MNEGKDFLFNLSYFFLGLEILIGANRYFYMCMDDLLALGGGSNFALRLEEDLLVFLFSSTTPL